jgi:hypothetical protein
MKPECSPPPPDSPARLGVVVGGGRRTRRIPPQIGVEKPVEVAVEHALEVADVMPRPLVLDPLVGVQEIVADLRPEARLGLQLVAGQLICFPLLLLHAGDPGTQHLDGGRPVLVLAPLALALHHDAGGEVGESDGAGSLVDVLAAGAAGAEDVLTDVLIADLNLRIVVGDLG